MKQTKPTGYVLHSDSERVVIATLRSENVKTGNMIQVWILDANQSPIETVKLGLDASICGDCKHRGAFEKRTCYVNVAKGPNSVYRAYKRGSYPFLAVSDYASVFLGRMVRLGAYGDPAMCDTDILHAICSTADGWTGYTHMWTTCNPVFKLFLMASVDSAGELQAARLAGWRTFRVRTASEALASREITCPASDEACKRTTCERCGLCDGSTGNNEHRASIAIVVHGIGKGNFVPLTALA